MKKKYKTKKIIIIKKIIRKDKKEKKSNKRKSNKRKSNKRKSNKRREKAGHEDRESLQNFMETMETRRQIIEFRNLLVREIGSINDLKILREAYEELVSNIITMQYYKKKPFTSLQERTAKAIKLSNALIDFFIKVLSGQDLNEREMQLIDTRAIDEYLKNAEKIKLYVSQIQNNSAIDRLGLETAVRGESRRNDFVKEPQKYRIKAMSRG